MKIKKILCKSKWFLIDASEFVLGRLASKICNFLHTKEYGHRLLLSNNYVVVVNTARIKVTGNKCNTKFYYKYSGFPGGLKKRSLGLLLHFFPERLLYIAVKGMLPRNILGRQALSRLKIYPNSIHPHIAQEADFLEKIKHG